MSDLTRPRHPDPYELLPRAAAMTVSSKAVADGEQIDSRYLFDSWGFTGDNVSPDLSWSGAPTDTKSFAVTCFDPDAPTPSGFWHWIVVDLPAGTDNLPENAGVSGNGGLPGNAYHVRNDYGLPAYGGGAPPQGDGSHRYLYAVHALNVEHLEIDDTVMPAVAAFNIGFHTLARGVLAPEYGW